MATLTCDIKLPQWITVAIAGVIGTSLALAFGGDEFQSNFLLFLHVVSYYITPWLAVLLIDYYLIRKSGRIFPPIENFYRPDGVFGRINIAGVTSLIVGFVVSIPFVANDFYTGPIGDALDGADLSYFVSGIVAALMYGFWRNATIAREGQ